MTNCNTCGLLETDCVCYEEEAEVVEVYVLVSGPAFRKTLGSQPDWTLGEYSPKGDERHTEEWEYIDGICCEVFRTPYGGLIAQPTRMVAVPVQLEVAVPVQLELAA